MITPQIIYNSTKGGLDILGKYFPEVYKAAEKKSHKFRIVSEQEDPNPSCVLNCYNGIYKIYSFQAGESYSAIDIVMREEGLTYSDAIKFIQAHFAIESEETVQRIAAEYRKRVAEKEGDDYFYYEEDDFTIKDCETIFAKNIWQYLCKKNTGRNKEKLEGEALGLFNANEVFRKYNFKKLNYYEFCGRDKKNQNQRVIHTFRSTELYPIFMFDEDYWQKIYKPAEPKSEYRFLSFGVKPKNYTFGLAQAQEEFDDLVQPQADDDENHELMKLDDVIMCTGGSDALNVAAIGYNVIWFNSETVKKEDIPFEMLKGIAHRVHYLGDLDSTGKDEALKLGLQFLELHIIDLPERLKMYRDDKNGRPCKDVKDYFQVFRVADFNGLLSRSYPLKFWEEKYKKDRKGILIKEFGRPVKEYKPDPELIYNFLKKHGFGRLRVLNEKDPMMIQVAENTVSVIDGEYARKFLKNFLRERNQDRRLINAFHRSPDLSDSSLESIDNIDLDFSDNDSESQWLFFQNKHIRVFAGKIEEFSPKKSGRCVWQDEIIKVDFKLMGTAPYRIFRNADGEPDIEILDDSCLYLRYLINTSRIHWREELEEKLDQLPKAEQISYREKYKWAIDGPLLDKEQIREQKIHLINKLTSLGYLLHRYKEPAQSYCVWGMDYVQRLGQSYGGTGKSIAYYGALSVMMKHHYIEGRKPDIAQNQFLLGKVNEHTDLIYIDDGHEYLDFTRFFSIVTGSIETMKKGIDAITLPFDISPKLCITSNFPPRSVDSATQRRMWFTAFADYYHKNPNGEYREDRDPKMEFGKNLFKEFTKEEWNFFLNTMTYALQAWLSIGKVDPPMKNVMQNQYRAKMGPNFHGWADTFFADGEKLNDYVQRTYAYKSYQIETGDNKTSSTTWLERLNYWCLYTGYELNPKDLVNPKDNRIIKKEHKLEYRPGLGVFEADVTKEKTACEMFYIRTPEGETKEKSKLNTTLPF